MMLVPGAHMTICLGRRDFLNFEFSSDIVHANDALRELLRTGRFPAQSHGAWTSLPCRLETIAFLFDFSFTGTRP
jgi:hypothetical protein